MTDRLPPALSNAIREAAWVAVDKQRSKAGFVAVVTKAASEAFDAQVHDAQAYNTGLGILAGKLADALEKHAREKPS